MAGQYDVLLNAGLVLDQSSVRAVTNSINQIGRSTNLNLNDRFSPALGRITSNLSQFNKSLDAATARVLAFGATASIIYGVERALSGTLRSMVDVEKAITDIGITMSATGKTLESFKSSLFEISKNTGQPFKIAAEAALELSRQGLGVDETLKRVNAALLLTRRTGMEAGASVEALTAAINSFSDSMLDANQLVNKMVAVDQSFAVSSKDLAEAIKRVGSSAQDAGVGIDELIALVTAAQQTTARGGAVIGNSFKTIFTRVQRGTVIDDLERLGVAVKDSERNLLPAQTVLKNLADTYDTLGQSQKAQVAELVGGVFQINVLKATLGDLSKQFSVYNSALNISRNAANEATIANEQLNQTLSALVNKTLVNLTQAGSKIGTGTLSPVLKTMGGLLNDALEATVNDEESKSFGARIGKGIIDGIGQFITGPGFVLAGGVFLKLLQNFVVDAQKALTSVLNINSAAQVQSVLYQDITNQLRSQPQLLEQIRNGELSITQVVKDRVAFAEREIAIRRMASQMSAITASEIMVGSKLGKDRFTGEMTFIPKGKFPNLSRVPSLLSDSFAREAAARPVSSIRIGSHPALASSFNPAGIGIYNTIDEPRGLSQGISRAISEGKNPKSYGIPNFARLPILEEQFSQGRFALAGEQQEKIKRAYLKLQNQIESTASNLKPEDVKRAASNFAKDFELTSKSAKSVSNALLKVKEKSDAFSSGLNQLTYKPSLANIYNPPPAGSMPSMGNVAGYPAISTIQKYGITHGLMDDAVRQFQSMQFEKSILKLEDKASSLFTGRAARLQLQKESINTALTQQEREYATIASRSAQSRFQGKLQTASIAAMIGAPILAETATQAISDRKQKSIVSGLGDVASYGALGFALAPGPVGLGVGAGIGAISATTKIYDAYNTKIPEITQLSERLTNSFGRLSENLQELSMVSDKLNQISNKQVSYRESEVKLLIGRQSRAIQQIEDVNVRQAINVALQNKDMQVLGDIITQAVLQGSGLSKAGYAAQQAQVTYESNRPGFLGTRAGRSLVAGAAMLPFAPLAPIAGMERFDEFFDKFRTNKGAGLTLSGTALNIGTRDTIRQYGYTRGLIPVKSEDSKILNLADYLGKNPEISAAIERNANKGNVDIVKKILLGANTGLSKEDLESQFEVFFDFIKQASSEKNTKERTVARLGLGEIIENFLRAPVQNEKIQEKQLTSARDLNQEKRMEQIVEETRSYVSLIQNLGARSANERILQRRQTGLEFGQFQQENLLKLQSPFLSESETNLRQTNQKYSAKKEVLQYNLSSESEKLTGALANSLSTISEEIRKALIEGNKNFTPDLRDTAKKTGESMFNAIEQFNKDLLSKGLFPEQAFDVIKNEIQKLEQRRSEIIKLSSVANSERNIAQKELYDKERDAIAKQLEVLQKNKQILENNISESQVQIELQNKLLDDETETIRKLTQIKNTLGLFGGIGNAGKFNEGYRDIGFKASAFSGAGGIQSQIELLDYIQNAGMRAPAQLQSQTLNNVIKQYQGYGLSKEEAMRVAGQQFSNRYAAMQQEDRLTFTAPTRQQLDKELLESVKNQNKLFKETERREILTNAVTRPNSIFGFRGITGGNSQNILEAIIGLQSGGGATRGQYLGRLGQLTGEMGYGISSELRQQMIQERIGQGVSPEQAAAQINKEFPKLQKTLDLREKQVEVENKLLQTLEEQYNITKKTEEVLAKLNFTIISNKFNAGEASGEEYRQALERKNKSDIATGQYGISNIKESFVSQWAYNEKDMLEDLDKTAKDLAISMRDGFKDAFHEFATGAKSAKEALRDLGINILDKLSTNIANIGINSVFGSAAKGLGLGNLFKSSGGKISGGSGVKDDVPAILMGGEFVLNKQAVNKYGENYLAALNKGAIPKFAGGGVVSNLENRYLYDNPTRPTRGWSEISSNLSNFALSDENSAINSLRMSREDELLSYLSEKAAYDEEKRKAISAFKKGKMQRRISSLMSAAMVIGGAGLNGAFKSSIPSNTLSLKYDSLFTGAAGGYLSDTTPALLMGGEMVMNRNAVSKYGVGFFNKLNTGSIQRFANGGPVGEPSPIYSNGMGDSLSNGISELISINTSIKEALTGERTNGTKPAVSKNETGSIINNVTITINSSGSEDKPTSNTQSDTTSTNTQDVQKNKKLADTIQQVVLNTIVKQQRNGGLLEKTRPS